MTHTCGRCEADTESERLYAIESVRASVKAADNSAQCVLGDNPTLWMHICETCYTPEDDLYEK